MEPIVTKPDRAARDDLWPLCPGGDPARRGAAQAFHGRTARGGIVDACGDEEDRRGGGDCLGVEITELIAEVERCLREDCGEFPRIELRF